jgi:hypothetical protein
MADFLQYVAYLAHVYVTLGDVAGEEVWILAGVIPDRSSALEQGV